MSSQPTPAILQPSTWFWPDISSLEQAQRVSRRGFYALGIIGLITLFGAPPQSLLVGAAFLLIAIGIRMGHATAAAAGMLVAAGPLAMLFLNRGPHWLTFLFSGFIQCILVAYFPFLSFRAIRMSERLRDEAGAPRKTSIRPGLLIWIPISLLVLAYFVFVAPNLFLVPEDRGELRSGDLVLLGRGAEARRIVWSFDVSSTDLKAGRFGTMDMYRRARWDRILQPVSADRIR